MQEEAAGLVAAYAGDKQMDIRDREQEVVDAWKNLQYSVDSRKNNLLDASDLYRFLAMVLDLTMWMNDILLQMKTQEKPRYCCLCSGLVSRRVAHVIEHPIDSLS